MKKLALLAVLFIYAALLANAQNPSKVREAAAITWLGLDYSLVKFTGETLNNPLEVKEKYIKSWNDIVLNEQKKYNLRELLRKSEIKYDLTIINKVNEKINASDLTTNNDYSIPAEKILDIVKAYDLTGKTGIGLVFIMERMNKIDKAGSMWVVFFDMQSKEIVFSKKMTGKAGGIGVRNYWANTFYTVMKDIGKDFDMMFK